MSLACASRVKKKTYLRRLARRHDSRMSGAGCVFFFVQHRIQRPSPPPSAPERFEALVPAPAVCPQSVEMLGAENHGEAKSQRFSASDFSRPRSDPPNRNNTTKMWRIYNTTRTTLPLCDDVLLVAKHDSLALDNHSTSCWTRTKSLYPQASGRGGDTVLAAAAVAKSPFFPSPSVA